jgi:hypothetical protein
LRTGLTFAVLIIFMMNEFYYNVSYKEYENLKIKTSDKILIRSTCDISTADMEHFIKRKLNIARSNIIKIEDIQRINKTMFLLLGGNSN